LVAQVRQLHENRVPFFLGRPRFGEIRDCAAEPIFSKRGFCLLACYLFIGQLGAVEVQHGLPQDFGSSGEFLVFVFHRPNQWVDQLQSERIPLRRFHFQQVTGGTNQVTHSIHSRAAPFFYRHHLKESSFAEPVHRLNVDFYGAVIRCKAA